MSNKRPRAVRKARTAHYLQPPKACICDSDTDDDDISRTAKSSKRLRSSYKHHPDHDTDTAKPPPCSVMSTLAPVKTQCNLDGWEHLKSLFSQAAEQYDDNSPVTMPLLRSVIHECNRFLQYYSDPSVIFMDPPRSHSRSPDTLTPPEERLKRDWGLDVDAADFRSSSRSSGKTSPHAHSRNKDLPTAFHTLYGIALFYFGNLIARNPSLALDGEPTIGAAYWLAALDVFEAGENLPSKTDGRAYGEDWRMAIAWGRTLVSLAGERAAGRHIPDEPRWPRGSPFASLQSSRSPMSRRMPLSASSANDMLVLAMDQFSRGILHMPHRPPMSTPCAPSARRSPTPEVAGFSRPKELFTIASEVLSVAERLPLPGQREYWAQWADGVFEQLKVEVQMDGWRRPILQARGRCWLIIGSSRAEDLELSLEAGDTKILETEGAQEARDGLRQAVSFFELAAGPFGPTTPSALDPGTQELHSLLAEALLTFANLTEDGATREALFARAQLVGGDQIEREPADHPMGDCH